VNALASITALTGLVAVLVACSEGNQPASSSSHPSTSTTGGAQPIRSASGTQPPGPTGDVDPNGRSRILVTIGDEQFEMTLDGSAAARDLIDQLPVTLRMHDHGAVEKTGLLPEPLSVKGQPSGADPEVADIGYYAPGNDLVFYYGDQSYFPGIVVLGRMDERAAERLASMDGSITATVALPPS
jgi:hypothetical protein